MKAPTYVLWGAHDPVLRFEFSDNGENRRAGTLCLLGSELASLTLEPFLLQ